MKWEDLSDHATSGIARKRTTRSLAVPATMHALGQEKSCVKMGRDQGDTLCAGDDRDPKDAGRWCSDCHLSTALEQGMIDGVVTVTADRLTLLPQSVVLVTAGEVLETAGSRYNWWVPLVAALKTAVIDRKLRKIAIVGVPCVIKAIYQIRTSDNDLLEPYGSRIRLSVGLFCTEIFDYQVLIQDFLAKNYRIETTDIDRIDVRGKLDITTRNKEMFSIPLSELRGAIRPGCQYCTDFAALCSDISAGAAGSPAGYTTLIVRTSVGQVFVNEAVTRGKLETGPAVDRAAIEKRAEAKMEGALEI